MVVVGSHLWHGVSSAFQSLGVDHPRWTPRILLAGKIVAVADRRRLHRHRAVGATSREAVAVMTLDAQDSGRPDRARSGTGTSSR